MFQSTPPRGGRPPMSSDVRCWAGSNPRPREGGDFHPIQKLYPQQVPIHAPARGATRI